MTLVAIKATGKNVCKLVDTNNFNNFENYRFNKDSWNSGGEKAGGFKKKSDFRR